MNETITITNLNIEKKTEVKGILYTFNDKKKNYIITVELGDISNPAIDVHVVKVQIKDLKTANIIPEIYYNIDRNTQINNIFAIVNILKKINSPDKNVVADIEFSKDTFKITATEMVEIKSNTNRGGTRHNMLQSKLVNTKMTKDQLLEKLARMTKTQLIRMVNEM